MDCVSRVGVVGIVRRQFRQLKLPLNLVAVWENKLLESRIRLPETCTEFWVTRVILFEIEFK